MAVTPVGTRRRWTAYPYRGACFSWRPIGAAGTYRYAPTTSSSAFVQLRNSPTHVGTVIDLRGAGLIDGEFLGGAAAE